MKKTSALDMFAVGFALFATFFGAGNLIFPPAIGIHSGTAWVQAILGMSGSAILLPIMTIIAVNNMGNDLSDLTKPVSGWFFSLYMFFFCLFVATMGIPRQGGIGVETGLFSILPGLREVKPALYICLAIYFIIVFVLAGNRSKVVDIVGKYLTPILLVILLAVVVLAIVKPVGTPDGSDASNPFINAFLEGYQTGDVMVGIVIASIFLGSIKEKGYTEKTAINRETLKAAVIALVGLLVVYGGFLYMGACAAQNYPHDMDQTLLLNTLVHDILGNIGSKFFGMGVFIACITTTIGVMSSTADMTVKMLGNKIPYRIALLVYCLIGFALGCLGVSAVVRYSLPSFNLIYPVSIVLTLLGTFRKWVPNHGAWKGAVLAALLVGIYEAMEQWVALAGQNPDFGILTTIHNAIPLASYGFAWLLPAVAGFVGGWLIVKLRHGEAYPMLAKEN